MVARDREIEPSVTVYYDGVCPLCAAEIGYYRRRRGADRVDWVDVSACPSGVVTDGLTREQALKRFHVRDETGRMLSGGAAFASLWTALPGFRLAGRLFQRQPFAWIIERAYTFFLRWRPALQRLAARRQRRLG